MVEASRFESRLPPHLPPDLADDLPEGPGVYLFRGEGGTLLYVGKSRNLRSRVLDHFSAGHRSGKEAKLAQQVREVEWIETGGELGALLLESRLVKELAPTANRRLRKSGGRVLRPSAGVGRRACGRASKPFGRGGSRRGRRSLRPVPHASATRGVRSKARRGRPGCASRCMGLEPGPGSCFALQLGRCRGACVGKEPLALHDARLRLALASLRLRAWPFAGPVGIRERAADGAGTLLHVVDRWQHLGTARDDGEVAELLRASRGRSFDPDSYRIVGTLPRALPPRDLVMLGRGEH